MKSEPDMFAELLPAPPEASHSAGSPFSNDDVIASRGQGMSDARRGMGAAMVCDLDARAGRRGTRGLGVSGQGE